MSEIRDFTTVKLESTELKSDLDVLAFKAVRFRDGKPVDRFIRYVRYEGDISRRVYLNTGISYEILEEQGVDESQAYKEFFNFIGDDIIVTNNMAFYRAFINKHNAKSKKSGTEGQDDREKYFFDDSHKKISTQWLAQSLILGVKDFEIDTLLEYFQLDYQKEDPLGQVRGIGSLLLKLEEAMKEQGKTLKI